MLKLKTNDRRNSGMDTIKSTHRKPNGIQAFNTNKIEVKVSGEKARKRTVTAESIKRQSEIRSQ